MSERRAQLVQWHGLHHFLQLVTVVADHGGRSFLPLTIVLFLHAGELLVGYGLDVFDVVKSLHLRRCVRSECLFLDLLRFVALAEGHRKTHSTSLSWRIVYHWGRQEAL